MDDDLARELRALLDERREAVLRRAHAGEEALAIVADARSSATADDEHDPEGGTLSDEWSRIAGLGEEARHELAEIDAACKRLRAGEYGVCVSCGQGIAIERLRARPMASRCVVCAR